MLRTGLVRTDKVIILVWAMVLVSGVTLFFSLLTAPLPAKEYNAIS